MAKIYLESGKTKHSQHNEDETSDEDTNLKSKFPRVIDMYSILSDLDHLKAERDEILAQQQGWMNGTHTLS
jgi:hypothetical protein